MSRKYRYVILAVAGWLALAAGQQPQQVNDNFQQHASTKVEQSRGDIVVSYGEANAPSGQEMPCPEGNDNRSSDLCAQWKAADSAQSAADAAWWVGGFGLLVGALTLGAAWSAAKWAKKAAEHTESGAVQSQRAADAAEKSLEQSGKVAQADLRAWLSVSLSLKNARRKGGNVIVGIEAAVCNIGKTPALGVAISLDAYIVPSAVINYGELPSLDNRQNQLSSLLPSASTKYAEGLQISKEDINKALLKCKSAGFPPMMVIDVVVFYHTTFDVTDMSKRLTSIRYYLVGKISPGAHDRSEQWEWLDKADALGKLNPSFGQDKSAPVYLT